MYMVRRSLLYCPGDESEMMDKAVDTDADTVILDFEDAVAPSSKEAARRKVQSFLNSLEDPSSNISVRINPYCRSGKADVDSITSDIGYIPDSIILPKAVNPEIIVSLNKQLLQNDNTKTDVIPLIETAEGVINAEEIATAPRVKAIAYGDQDFTADIGANVTDDETESLYARQKLVTAAAAADVDAIDTVYTEITDLDGLQERTRFAIDLGFDGKLVIHPNQVNIVNNAFTPARDQINWAEQVIEGQENASKNEKGVFTVDNQMIDPPLIERARKILARAEAANVR